MPEGDTVFALARRLRAALDGCVLAEGRLNVPAHAVEKLDGRTVLGHRTYGKHLLTDFDGGVTLHTHLKMTGSWTVVRTGRRLPRRLDSEVRVRLSVSDGPTAYGLTLPVVQFSTTRDADASLAYLGPDPLREDFDPALAAANIRRDAQRPIIAVLLDQRVMAGPGNLWANELCFLRGLGPWVPAGAVDADKLVALTRKAMRHSVSTPRSMQVTTGDTRPGRQHWVAGRAGKPCLRCGTTVRVVPEVHGDPERRRTWWCPHCQPGPDRS
ncbi:MAG: DNA-formamidopyrimidine glycosylase family protein [Rhodococcus sp. (in: high G+C Gram-positive bacteria)]